ncbi:hypothetical protein EBX93_14385, partial [bacterium]|nr:hypothetical protein [bacterium]
MKLYSNNGPITLGSITTDNGGLLTNVSITGPLTGFTNGETVTITGGITNAIGTAIVNGSGNLTNISLTNPGSGFVNGQTISITGNTSSATTTGTALVATNIDIQANSGAVTVGALTSGVNAAGAINIKHGSTLTLNNNISAGSFTETVDSIGNIVVGNATPVTFQVSGT